MSKTQGERPATGKPVEAGPAPLNAGIRCHLGRSLRTHFADVLTQPVDARMEALLERLGKPGR